MARSQDIWAEVAVYRPGGGGEIPEYVTWLRDWSANVTLHGTATAMRAQLSEQTPDVVLLDYAAGDEVVDVVEVEDFCQLRPCLRWIALVPKELSASPRLAALVQRRLLHNYQTFPVDKSRLLFEVGHVRGLVRLERTAGPLAPAATGEEEPYMVGSHAAMLEVYSSIRKIAKTNTPVLITGESGTGKELVAQAVHERSPFRDGPFVPINCAGIPSTLIASELFGHERGAFTDAKERRIGKIEQASKGTLFLDEIGDLPLELQGHLLRFLQEKTIERVGGRSPIEVSTRVVAATNVDLWEAVEEGRFRKDLYYRLNVLHLHLPPLRERGGDAELLARYFLQRFGRELDRPDILFKPSAIEAIRAYSWPGNVRELISVVRRAVVMAGSRRIDARSMGLPIELPTDTPVETLEQARARAEQQTIERALRKHADNIQRAAKELGVSRVTLYRLIEKHSISYATRARNAEINWVMDSDRR